MPRLLLFVPCLRVIEDKADNTTTLFCLLEKVRVVIVPGLQPDPDENLSIDENMPFDWTVATTWQFDDDDIGKEYQLRLRRLLPDGEETEGNIVTIKVEKQETHLRINFRFPQMLVRNPGLHMLKLYLRETGDENLEWNRVGEYPLIIEHAIQGPTKHE